MEPSNAARRSLRPRLFAGRSIRGLLDVMPSQDLQFFGVTIGWVGIGFVRTVKR